MWLQQGGESLVSSERGQVFAVVAAALSGNLQCQANTRFASLVVCARLEVGAMAGSRLCQVLAKKKDPSHCCPLLQHGSARLSHGVHRGTAALETCFGCLCSSPEPAERLMNSVGFFSLLRLF